MSDIFTGAHTHMKKMGSRQERGHNNRREVSVSGQEAGFWFKEEAEGVKLSSISQ